jgi:hypothetical protein
MDFIRDFGEGQERRRAKLRKSEEKSLWEEPTALSGVRRSRRPPALLNTTHLFHGPIAEDGLAVYEALVDRAKVATVI